MHLCGLCLVVKRRYLSLYFSSIGLIQVGVILGGVIASLFRSSASRRAALHNIVNNRLRSQACFSYSSARGALAACLTAANLNSEDEVLLSSYSCLAVPTAVIAAGARPTYCDIDPKTLNVTADAVMTAISPKTKVVVVQHTLGSIAPVEKIKQMLHGSGIWVIEDCALSLGSQHQGVSVGQLGDAAIFSMELSKTVSTGWGGLLVVHDKALALQVGAQYERIQALPFLRSLQMSIQTAISALCYMPNIYWLGKYIIAVGFKTKLFMKSTPDAENEGQVSSGFVSKLAGLQAALAIHQWKRMDAITQSCLSNGIRIRNLVTRLGYVPLGLFNENTHSVSPRISILVSDRRLILAWFQQKGIELGVWFDGPLSPLPNVSVYHYNRTDFPKASFIADHVVNIPCHSRLTQSDFRLIETAMIEYAAMHPEDVLLQVYAQPSLSKNQDKVCVE